MGNLSKRIVGSPFYIAVTFGIFGAVWIGVTDQLVLATVDDPERVTQLQTVKGWVFVTIATLLVYGLVFYSQRKLEATNERLDTALQQTSILYRLLRHNLRNSCNVIQANARMLADDDTTERESSVEKIEAHTDRLVRLSQRSARLRDIVLADSLPTMEIDLVETIETQVKNVEDRYPEAEIHTNLPDALPMEMDSRIGDVIYELLENAIEHNDGTRPTVRLNVEVQSDGRTLITVEDDGPGLPDIERDVLEHGFETPMYHSEGLGLWMARMLIVRLDGTFNVDDNELRGALVRISLPPSLRRR